MTDSTPQEGTPLHRPIRPVLLEALGFQNFSGGSMWRKVYREGFVIDALAPCMDTAWRLELRAGSEARRINLKAESADELETFIRMLERGERGLK